IAYLDQLHHFVIGGAQRVPARVVVLGFSQGAATAARWVAARKPTVNDVVLWGGSVPPEIPRGSETFGKAKLTLVFGSADRQTPAAWIQQETAALNAAGLSHDVLLFDGGHEIAAEPLQRLASRYSEDFGG
ncbi:MAG TPA: dienelactone hydrolase family protein, partial [Longimicrobiales bacterium]